MKFQSRLRFQASELNSQSGSRKKCMYGDSGLSAQGVSQCLFEIFRPELYCMTHLAAKPVKY